MYFQPIKNQDPHLDFYTMYNREATEYDVEYMKNLAQRGPQYYSRFCRSRRPLGRQKCSPHPQAGLFSAVSSAFTIDVQSKLEPDSGDRSETYLRAILLSLNRSIAPAEQPNNLKHPICESLNVALSLVCDDFGQAVAEPLPPTVTDRW